MSNWKADGLAAIGSIREIEKAWQDLGADDCRVACFGSRDEALCRFCDPFDGTTHLLTRFRPSQHLFVFTGTPLVRHLWPAIANAINSHLAPRVSLVELSTAMLSKEPISSWSNRHCLTWTSSRTARNCNPTCLRLVIRSRESLP